MSTCFIVLTMVAGLKPVAINTDAIVEFYTARENFSLVVFRESHTRVKETSEQILKKIKGCK